MMFFSVVCTATFMIRSVANMQTNDGVFVCPIAMCTFVPFIDTAQKSSHIFYLKFPYISRCFRALTGGS